VDLCFRTHTRRTRKIALYFDQNRNIHLQAVQPPRTALLGNTQGRPVGSHHERGRPRCGEHPLVATAIFFFGIGFSRVIVPKEMQRQARAATRR
jgi:hypothetical protein